VKGGPFGGWIRMFCLSMLMFWQILWPFDAMLVLESIAVLVLRMFFFSEVILISRCRFQFVGRSLVGVKLEA